MKGSRPAVKESVWFVLDSPDVGRRVFVDFGSSSEVANFWISVIFSCVCLPRLLLCL